MRIAVTGASGWVGRAVTDVAANRGHDVIAIDVDDTSPPSATAFIRADMHDYEAVLAALGGCEALVHLAAISGPGRLPDQVVHDTNVLASYHALRAAAERGIRRVSQASSVNAIGGRFSRVAVYDYFPVDEQHPTHAEDPYSLSKWICEQQADAIARRYEGMGIASLRLHGVVTGFANTQPWLDLPESIVERQLWGWTRREAAARAFVDAIEADFIGHEAFYIVAPETMVATPSLELHAEHYADVPLRGDLSGTTAFYDCSKANRMLGWHHGPE